MSPDSETTAIVIAESNHCKTRLPLCGSSGRRRVASWASAERRRHTQRSGLVDWAGCDPHVSIFSGVTSHSGPLRNLLRAPSLHGIKFIRRQVAQVLKTMDIDSC